MPLCGGAGSPQEATEEVQNICKEIKPKAEEAIGKKFDEFKAISYSTQIVSGTNFFIKVFIGGDKYVHLCVHRPLPFKNEPLELLRHQTDKLGHEAIGFF